MSYDLPGYVEAGAGTAIREAWNDAIRRTYESMSELHSRFFTIAPEQLQTPTPAELSWFGDPAEPAFCLGATVAQQLSDWGVRGRHATHNEYCEYSVVYAPDPQGRRRPKRVQVTTELREYWVTLAVQDPTLLQEAASDVLGTVPSMQALYGRDPVPLSPAERLQAFSEQTAGSGGRGEPRQPRGPLNTENALFMSHPINGLDDLIYIVLYGASVPRAIRRAQVLEPAAKAAIFRSDGVEHLACRHADPAAAMGAQGLAWQGRTIAFANPVGMYIRTFAEGLFSFNEQPVPAEWVRWSRGDQPGRYQRLEFGPSDTDAHFLDEISVEVPGAPGPVPVVGGFQVVRHVEVGPLIVHGDGAPPKTEEIKVIDDVPAGIDCGAAEVCQAMRALKRAYDEENSPPVHRIRRRRILGRV